MPFWFLTPVTSIPLSSLTRRLRSRFWPSLLSPSRVGRSRSLHFLYHLYPLWGVSDPRFFLHPVFPWPLSMSDSLHQHPHQIFHGAFPIPILHLSNFFDISLGRSRSPAHFLPIEPSHPRVWALSGLALPIDSRHIAMLHLRETTLSNLDRCIFTAD